MVSEVPGRYLELVPDAQPCPPDRPQSEEGLARAIGEAHRRYTRRINFRERWRGHLWQERFASFPMDETYLLAAARYVEMNPVHAGLVKRPEDYRWSSARAHLEGKDDALAKVEPLLEIVADWRAFLTAPENVDADRLRQHERTGRPLGQDSFVERLEAALNRPSARRNPGRRRRRASSFVYCPPSPVPEPPTSSRPTLTFRAFS